MPAPAVLAEPPPGWVEAAIPRPPLGDAADVRFTSFRSYRPRGGVAGIAAGCVAAPIPGWVEDMRPSMEGRAVGLAGAAAERVAGKPVDARPGAAPGTFVLRVAGGGEAPIGAARTALGFGEDGSLATCFAVCALDVPTCDAWITTVRFDPGAPPPPPGVGLAAVTWAVHHPGPVGTAAGAAAVALGVIAVASRRKPRTRI